MSEYVVKTADASANTVPPVDEILPLMQMIIYAFQHVLVMYVGAIAVPLIIGKLVGLTDPQIIFLISTDLCICGLSTIVQALGVGNWFGSRLPLIQGCSFAALIPMKLIGEEYGLGAISGAVIIGGLFVICVAPWISRLIRFFPKSVMGSIVTLIGLSILPIAGGWIGGGDIHADSFGETNSLLMAFITLFIVLFLYTFATGMLRNIAVLVGIVLGSLAYYFTGQLNFEQVKTTAWFSFPKPLFFSPLEFHVIPIVLICLVMVVIMVESMSSIMALGEIVDRPVNQKILRRGLSACGLGSVVGGFFNLFPYSVFSQNIGLVSMSGIKSRFVIVVSGCILIIMGLIPKLAALVLVVPKPVLGGAGLVMFGMVAIAGIQTLSKVDYHNNNNAMVITLTLSIGLMPSLVPSLFSKLPESISIFLHSGITLGTVVAILANLLLNGHGNHHVKKAQKTIEIQENFPMEEFTTAGRLALRTVRGYLLLKMVKQAQKGKVVKITDSRKTS